MSWKNRFVVCFRDRQAFGNHYIFESSAQHNAAVMNRIAAGRSAHYHVHPAADLDDSGRCPHHVPFDLHRVALPALAARAVDNPRLAALLGELKRQEEEL